MTAMNEVNTVNERNMDMEGKAVKEKRTYTVKEIHRRSWMSASQQFMPY